MTREDAIFGAVFAEGVSEDNWTQSHHIYSKAWLKNQAVRSTGGSKKHERFATGRRTKPEDKAVSKTLKDGDLARTSSSGTFGRGGTKPTHGPWSRPKVAELVFKTGFKICMNKRLAGKNWNSYPWDKNLDLRKKSQSKIRSGLNYWQERRRGVAMRIQAPPPRMTFATSSWFYSILKSLMYFLLKSERCLVFETQSNSCKNLTTSSGRPVFPVGMRPRRDVRMNNYRVAPKPRPSHPGKVGSQSVEKPWSR